MFVFSNQTPSRGNYCAEPGTYTPVVAATCMPTWIRCAEFAVVPCLIRAHAEAAESKKEISLHACIPMADSVTPTNAVLDDQDLQAGLRSVHPAFGDLCTRVAGEVWGHPLIDQRTKALITIALDVANQGLMPESPYEAHIRMALKQGSTFSQIEELLLFCCVYAGFNKVAPAFGRLSAIRKTIEAP